MIKLSDIPNISKEFNKVIAKYFIYDADPVKTIPVVETFLEKYPHYPEAYNFMAVLHLANGESSKALKYLKAVERIDQWRLHGIFDKAEVYISRDKTSDGISTLIKGIEDYSVELKDGIDNFIVCSDPKNQKIFRNKIINAVLEYFKNNEDTSKPFQKLKEELSCWEFECLK